MAYSNSSKNRAASRGFGFKLLDRYLFQLLIPINIAALTLFTIIWIAPELLFKLTQYAFAGQVTATQAATMLLFHVPEVLQQTMPVAVLLGSIFLFQRLSKDYEWVSILASGISTKRALSSVLLVGAIFSILHGIVQEVILPMSAPRLDEMYHALNLKDRPDRNFLFVEKNHEKRLSKFFMIGRVEPSNLKDFVVLYYNDTPNEGVYITRILRSHSGHWLSHEQQWELDKGIEYVLTPEGVYKEIRAFDHQQVRTDHYACLLLHYTRMNPMVLPFVELKQYIRLLKEGGQLQDVPYFEVRLWQKFSAPLATLLFSVIGALLGIEHVRSNRIFGLTFGALIVFIYSISTPFAGSFGSLDLFAPWIVAFLPLTFSILVSWGLIKFRHSTTG
jgi:lipopolysaccharide export system permease protein